MQFWRFRNYIKFNLSDINCSTHSGLKLLFVLFSPGFTGGLLASPIFDLNLTLVWVLDYKKSEGLEYE